MFPDLETLIKTIGLVGVLAVVFAESGLLIGFFFPGDSLLFTAGFLASHDFFNIYLLALGAFLAAVGGDSTGYAFGHKIGKKLFQKKDSLIFHQDNLIKAQNFYQKHGKKTIILARFIPVIRTFAPIVAGVGDMEYSTFLTFNIIGAALWSIGITLAGFYLGKLVRNIDSYLLPIIFLIIAVSILPNLIHIFKSKENRQQLLRLLDYSLKKVLSK